jgi:dienelactone hydrolase
MFKSVRIYALLAALFLLAACQGTGVKFLSGNHGNLRGEALTVSALLFQPDGKGPFPAVVLLYTCGGYQRHVTEGWPSFLTKNGYVVLTVDSYPPRGFQTCDKAGSRIHWMGAQADDAFAALDYLAGLGNVDSDRVGVMGFSAGAFAINEMIVSMNRREGRMRTFRAAISLYGACRGLGLFYSKEYLPLMQIAGELDEHLAPSCVDAGKTTSMVVHLLENTYHAFDQPQITDIRYDNAGNPMRYSPSATTRAENLTKEFFAKHLGK